MELMVRAYGRAPELVLHVGLREVVGAPPVEVRRHAVRDGVDGAGLRTSTRAGSSRRSS